MIKRTTIAKIVGASEKRAQTWGLSFGMTKVRKYNEIIVGSLQITNADSENASLLRSDFVENYLNCSMSAKRKINESTC